MKMKKYDLTIERVKSYFNISQVTYYRIKNGDYDHLIEGKRHGS
jgi:hypothetical protein